MDKLKYGGERERGGIDRDRVCRDCSFLRRKKERRMEWWICLPGEGRVGPLQENAGDAMEKHLVDEEADDQRSELYSNDIKIGIERGANRGRVEKENVGSVVGSSRTIVFAALFLHEEHLKTTTRSFKSLSSPLLVGEFSSHDSS